MKNFTQEGRAIYVTAPVGGVVSGNFYMFGAMFGIAGADAPAGQTFALWNGGSMYLLPATASEVWTVGEPIYWTGAGPATSASGGTKIGVATQPKAAGVAVSEVKLNASY